MREYPAFDRGRDALLDGGVGRDRHHVRARRHHLADDHVAELEDRVDQLALVALDRLLVGGDVGHRADLLLGDERALLEAASGQDDVGEADQAASRAQRSGGKFVRKREQPGDAQRRPVGVLDRVGLRHDLADHEEQRRSATRCRCTNPSVPNVLLEQDTRRAIAVVSWQHEHEQADDVERPLRLLEHARQPPAPRAPSSSSASARTRLIRVNAVSAMRQHARRPGTARRSPRRVASPLRSCHAGIWTRAHRPSSCSSSRNRANSSRSRFLIASDSWSSAWS